MAGLQVAELPPGARAQQQFALFRIAPQKTQRALGIVLGQRDLFADGIGLDKLRSQQGLLEAGDRFVDHAAGAQRIVSDLADLGQVQQRARNDLVLVQFATDLQSPFELLHGLLVAPESEQGAAGLESLEALVRAIAEGEIDLQRFAGGR